MKLLKRMPMISWMIIPMIGVWIATNYLIGTLRQPNWSVNGANAQISQAKLPPLPPINYQNTGLVTFWFDDAYLTQYTSAFPKLQEKGFVAAEAVPIKAVGTNNYMNWMQLKKLQVNGWEITSHTRTHDCEPSKLNAEGLKSELLGAKQDLESQGLRADSFVTPCGIGSEAELEEAKKVYSSLRTTDDGLNSIPVEDPYHLKTHEVRVDTSLDEIQEWVSEAKDKHGWLILMFHKVDDSGEKFSVSPDNFSKILDMVDGSSLPVVLPTPVIEIKGQQ
jgi:peptidoglycan/xylan/chitin deacetylase (PgdA/CDA1 family)